MRRILTALLVAAALVTPACAEKRDYNTIAIPQNEGANVNVGQVMLRNAFLIGGPAGRPLQPGASVPMYLALLNNGRGADKLVSVSAQGVFQGAILPAGGLVVPPNGFVGGTPTPQVLMTGLVKQLRSGSTVPVRLRFQHTGSTTVQVPVLPPSNWRATYSPWPAAPAKPTPTPSPSPWR
jgi:copper(I)-binding protein